VGAILAALPATVKATSGTAPVAPPLALTEAHASKMVEEADIRRHNRLIAERKRKHDEMVEELTYNHDLDMLSKY
jgi:hypothetical protein